MPAKVVAGQSKWGRHCCRPHSHRRVGALSRFRLRQAAGCCLDRDTLGARCLAPARIPRGVALDPGFVTGARTGIRLSLVLLQRPVGAQGPFPSLPKHSLGRDRLSVAAGHSCSMSGFGLHLRSCPARLAVCPATLLHTPFKDGRLAFDQGLGHVVLNCARGQASPPSSTLKNAFTSRSCDPRVPVILCPEDKLKVRLKRRSGKHRNPKLSTFPQFACGQGWISQRLVAFVEQGEVQGNETRCHASRFRVHSSKKQRRLVSGVAIAPRQQPQT